MKKLLGLILIICGLGLGFFVIPLLTDSMAWNEAAPTVRSGDEAAVTEKLSDIAELSVLDFKYSNATSITDSIEVEKFRKKFNIPFTRKQIVMVYKGDIKLGTDADRITADIRKGDDGSVEEVTVGLPPIRITSNDIDRETINYPLEKNNILNSIRSSDYAGMEEDGKAAMAEAVSENGAMDRAREELKATIKGYLTAIYGEDVKISFRDIS